jgi:hypothetical protein
MQRPDIPLANTPDPQPVTSGLKPMNEQFTQPVTKYQATADAAIQQIGKLSKESMPQPAAPKPSIDNQQQ